MRKMRSRTKSQWWVYAGLLEYTVRKEEDEDGNIIYVGKKLNSPHRVHNFICNSIGISPTELCYR